MKKGAILFVLLALFLLLVTVEVSAQQKSPSPITVKASQLMNGVLIVDVLKTGKPYELRCNDGAADCTKLRTGKYQMVNYRRTSECTSATTSRCIPGRLSLRRAVRNLASTA